MKNIAKTMKKVMNNIAKTRKKVMKNIENQLDMNWNLLESKPKAFQRISFSQAKKNMNDRIHNSVVCLRVHYCVQLLPEVMFFSTISFPFSFAKICFPFT